MPDPANSQQYNRYSYVLNNPIAYNDPTGHCRKNADGEYEYAFDCTVEEFTSLSWDERIQWVEDFMADTKVEWFYNVIGIIEFYRDSSVFSGSECASIADAGTLAAIQDGYRISADKLDPIGTGGEKWGEFFSAVPNLSSENESQIIALWGEAEQSGIEYGLSQASVARDMAGAHESIYIDSMIGFSNIYRSMIMNGAHESTPWSPTIDQLLAINSAPLLDPRTQESRQFVGAFSHNVIVPFARGLISIFESSQNGQFGGY